MGKRSRRRSDALVTPAPAPARRSPSRRLGEERPRAPWHPFPLVELSVFVGLVLLVWGLFRRDDDGGRVMLVCGLLLASLGGLDTALREHFSGLRSHAMILAAAPAVGLAAILFFGGAPWPLVTAAPAITFAAALPLLLRAYRRRAG